MIMTYTGYFLTALGYIAGFIVLALFWIWLILVFAEAIAQLWREVVIQSRLSVSAFRVSSPVSTLPPNSLSNAAASRKSLVSKPSVNQP